MKNHHYFNFRAFSFAFCCYVKINTIFCQDIIINTIPESYPGALDGQLEIKVQDVGFGIGQNPPPFYFSLTVLGENSQLISNSSGEATYTNLGFKYYCLSVSNGSGCYTQTCFQFEEACSTDGCLIANFDFAYTFDGCTVQFYDWSHGDANEWEWDFGDGTKSTDQNPIHTYIESKCYNVTLEATDGSLTREASKVVCLAACSDYNNPVPNCQINAPTIAAPGQEIHLDLVPMGISPFTYQWSIPTDFDLAPGFSSNDPNTLGLISNSLDNGDQLNFSAQVFDNNNYPSTCYHTITIGGNVPDVEVAAFGSFEDGQPLVVVAFVDFFNLTGLEEYFFKLKPLGNQNFDADGTCLNKWLNGDWDCTLDQVPEGYYELCVDVKDDAGTYQDCMFITIGDPPPLPPDPPDMWIEVKSPSNPEIDLETGNIIVKEGSPIRVGISGSHPDEYGCGEYMIVWHVENLTTKVNETIGTISPVTIGSDVCYCTNCDDTGPTGINWTGRTFSVDCDIPIYSKGTIKITAEIFSSCTGNFICENEFLTPIPLYIDLHPGKPVISEISVNNDACDLPVKVKLSSSCSIASYEWHAYDPSSNEEIEGFFAGNTNAATVYPDLGHDMYFQYQSGAVVRFRCKVIVVDIYGFTAEYSSLVTMRVPLRIDLPATIYRCSGAESHFLETSIAVGGINRYEYKWTVVQPIGGDLDFDSNDPNDPNPLFTAPTNGTKQYHLRIKSLNEYGQLVCQVEKDITVNISNISLNLPDITIPVCREGGKKIGPTDPTNLGGSGQYSFLWSCSNPAGLNYLSNKHVPNPLISGIPAGESIIYTLTVTDLFGGCTTSDELTVVSVANNISVTLPSSTTVCYGEEVTITGNVNPFSQIHHEWTTNHPKTELVQNGGSGPKKQLTFSEIMCSYPGTYNITLKATDIVSGCTAEATTSLTVRAPWRYVGYVSKIASATKNSSMPLWEPGSNNYFTSNPPNLNNIEVSWHPYPPHQGSITYYGNTALPTNGSFTPTKEVPFLTMTVYDNVSGCSKTVRTMRYIISEYEPRLNIFAGNGASCIGDPVCFDLVFDAQLENYTTPLLPDHITAMVTIHAPNNVPQQPDFKGIPVKLLLENSSGLYKAKVCETDFFQYETYNGSHYMASLSMGNGVWSNVESASVEVAVNETSTSNGHIINCLPININNGHERGLSYRFGLQCTGSAVHNAASYTFARDYIELLPDNDLELIPGTVSGSYNKGAYLGIDPCIIPQAVGDNPNNLLSSALVEERSINTDFSQKYPLLLDVFPNPFEDEVNIEFHIPKDCVGRTSIVLYDIMGKEKAIVYLQENCLSGVHQTRFKTDNIPSGIYFCELKTCNNLRISRKLVKITNH